MLLRSSRQACSTDRALRLTSGVPAEVLAKTPESSQRYEARLCASMAKMLLSVDWATMPYSIVFPGGGVQGAAVLKARVGVCCPAQAASPRSVVRAEPTACDKVDSDCLFASPLRHVIYIRRYGGVRFRPDNVEHNVDQELRDSEHTVSNA